MAPVYVRILFLLAVIPFVLSTPCGRQSRGALCAAKECCSALGECGKGSDFCGKGCQSGPCLPLPKVFLDENAKPVDPSQSTNPSNEASPTQSSPSPTATPPPGGFSSLTRMTPIMDIYNQYMSCAFIGSISITYDDGPSPYTPNVLDALRTRNVKTTFFWLGSLMDQYPATVRRAYDDGHHIASHTFTHSDLGRMTLAQIRDELTRTEAAMFRAIGVAPKYMRCPYGSITAEGAREIQRLGYKMIYWNLDTYDWNHPTNREASFSVYTGNITAASVRSNSWISLQHDIHLLSTQMAGDVADYCSRQGLVLGTVPDCLGFTDPNERYHTTLPSPTR
ncbi:hypothetical protein BKA69DRAFT_1081893 [Paraphysoderma sedebokerense]|nr:hypothetical protein BKA69DRAFT_1081893 [Paraphysoderma sedebokerense]